MTFVIIIFFISIVLAFMMLLFKVWQIKTAPHTIKETMNPTIPEFPFRHFEKSMLYLIKHILQSLLFVLAKYWFIILAKVKKIFNEKWPKINSYFKKKEISNRPYRRSFLEKAILESKAQIKTIKDKVKEEIK